MGKNGGGGAGADREVCEVGLDGFAGEVFL